MNLDNFVFFTLIYQWIDIQIDAFALGMMRRTMDFVSALALTLVTIWIMLQGYRVLTGQLREPLMGLVVSMAKVVLIVTAATSMSVFGGSIRTFFTTDLDQGVNELFTGRADWSTTKTIDRNLALTQVALSSIDAIKTLPDDAENREEKIRAMTLATFGTASPPMTAAALLLMYQFAIALVVGLGPLFILCLLFDQTKELFRRWLFYGIGTVFSMGMLSVVSSIVLSLSVRLAGAAWLNRAIQGILFGNPEGITNEAIQSGGIGLLLTLLLISIPPMAALFFNGTMGGFMHYSAWGSGSSNQPDSRGRPVGAYSEPPPPINTPSNTRSTEIPSGDVLHANRALIAPTNRPK